MLLRKLKKNLQSLTDFSVDSNEITKKTLSNTFEKNSFANEGLEPKLSFFKLALDCSLKIKKSVSVFKIVKYGFRFLSRSIFKNASFQIALPIAEFFYDKTTNLFRTK